MEVKVVYTPMSNFLNIDSGMLKHVPGTYIFQILAIVTVVIIFLTFHKFYLKICQMNMQNTGMKLCYPPPINKEWSIHKHLNKRAVI